MTDTIDERDDQERRAAAEPGDDAGDAASTSAVEATRTRMQGNGVGQRELAAQRDPNRAATDDQFSGSGEAKPEAD